MCSLTHHSIGDEGAGFQKSTPMNCVPFFSLSTTTPRKWGWRPKNRLRFNDCAADDYYETLARRVVEPGLSWVHRDRGRSPLPSNTPLVDELSAKESNVFGIDPDPNIKAKPFVNERFEDLAGNWEVNDQFDAITLRTVAKHVPYPSASVAKFWERASPGEIVVIYRTGKWAPMSTTASLIPLSVQNPLKRLPWNSESQENFTTQSRMNSRSDLTSIFGNKRFATMYFSNVADCSITALYTLLNDYRLALRTCLNKLARYHPFGALLTGGIPKPVQRSKRR